MKKKHIAIIFDDGWKNARNFIYSGFIHEIINSFQVSIFSRNPKSSAFSLLPSCVKIHPLQISYEHPLLRKYRKFVMLYHNVVLNNIGFHKWVHTCNIDSDYNLLQKIFSKIGTLSILKLLTLMEYRLGSLLGENKHWKYIYNKLNIDTLLVSYQSDSILSALQTAVNMQLYTLIVPLSWKDIFTFPHIKIIPSYYLLWSKNILEYYKLFNPWVDIGTFKVIGSLYLEPYKNKSNQLDKDMFYKKAGLDPNRPYLCYTAASTNAILHEDKIVFEILNAIKNNKIQHNPQLLLRLNPIDKNNQFYYLLDLFRDNLVFQKPNWEISNNWVCPTPEDNDLWISTIFYAKLNISIPSTASLEFLAMDRPVINICFDYPTELPYFMSNKRYWEAEFYKEAKESKLIIPTYSMNSLIKNINDQIIGDNHDKCDIAWMYYNSLYNLIKLL
jgi:hypothetical protein